MVHVFFSIPSLFYQNHPFAASEASRTLASGLSTLTVLKLVVD